MKKLRIAQVAPPFISVPPVGYGGTELVVHNITEELVKRGHEVTLFASGDSKTAATLVSTFDFAIKGKEETLFSPLAYKLLWMHSLPALEHVKKAYESADNFDIIHDHTHYLGLEFASFVKTPVVSTYHGSLDLAVQSPIERYIFEKNKDHPWVAISENQKNNCSLPLNFASVIFNGIAVEDYPYQETPEDYYVWLGRITPKKGLIDAIKAAQKANVKLMISGVVNERDQEFFNKEVEPLLHSPNIVFTGASDFKKKAELFGKAKALLYPVQWEEPFGLVMAEALACGTPVIGYRRGSVPEIIKEEKTGYIVDDVEGLVSAIQKIENMSNEAYHQMRKDARDDALARFTIEYMVDGYEKTYEQLLERNHR
jgi:glycosyltransferase involved in cell wall biosynthesis